jgi:hypothetical protein
MDSKVIFRIGVLVGFICGLTVMALVHIATGVLENWR